MGWLDGLMMAMAAIPPGKVPKGGGGNAHAKTELREATIPRMDLSREIKGFVHTGQWTCGCGAQLRIRARDDRETGPSNYRGDFPSGPLVGQDIVPHHELNWNGLAHKNGWKTSPGVPAQCPACQRGWSLEDYRKKFREVQASRDAIVHQFSSIARFSTDEHRRYRSLIGPVDAQLEKLRRVKDD
jgi:hypothetical protein